VSEVSSPSPAPRRRLAAFSDRLDMPDIQAVLGLASRRLDHRIRQRKSDTRH